MSFRFRFRFIVFNMTFNNISVISWRSVLLVEEIGVPGENHWPVVSHWQTLSHNCIEYTPPWVGFILTTLVKIGTDSICNCDSTTIWSWQRQPFKYVSFNLLTLLAEQKEQTCQSIVHPLRVVPHAFQFWTAAQFYHTVQTMSNFLVSSHLV